jgi:hypothetical protein
MICAMTAPPMAAELDQILEGAATRLLAVSDEAAGRRSAPGRWSKKEILGHLIDSAANNHQRFVRLQIEDHLVFPGYRQNDWVALQHYSDRPWRDLVELWLAYNRHLAYVIRRVDARAGGHLWKRPEGDVDLRFLIADYLRHLQHHLEQIVAD